MFAYLASQNGRAVPRDELAELLWGEELPATWEKALRVLMTKLRALLEECGIDGSTALKSAFGCYKLTLPGGAWIDVDAAVEALERAEAALAACDFGEARSQATSAAALARRSFLPGEEGAWVEEKRRDLHEVLVRSLECLRDACFRAGDHAEAVRHAEEVTALEPFRESGYRKLMEAHTSAGNTAEALRVYERCRRFLADELGAYPSPETEAAYLGLLRADPAGAGENGTVLKPDRPSRPRVRAVVALGGALVLAAAVAAGIFELVRGEGGGATPPEIAGNAVAALDAGSRAVRDVVEAPAPPTAMAAGLGYVWVASADSNTVVVVDPRTNTVRDTVAVESAPGGIAIGGDWIWVTNSLTGTVSQISPQTLSVVQTIAVGNGPTGIASGDGYVWVANTSDHTVSKLRSTDGKLIATFAAGSDPGAVAVGAGAVWIASKLSGAVVKLGTTSGEILDRIAVGAGPAGVAVDGRSVWVANSLSGTVSRIDARTGDVRKTTEIGSSADAVAIAQGDVWAANGLDRRVSRIDGRDGRVQTVDVGDRPTALAAAGGTVYVGVRPSGSDHVGGTLNVLLSNPGTPQVDPANAYSSDSWRTLGLTNDGLVGWRRVGGQAGTELVPDLAVSLPSVSDDRRRYTFLLRQGIRYSDGRLLKASDVRYSIERLYRLRPRPEQAAMEFYRAIVGANRCVERPARCDLSRGILTDDRAGTVSFRLASPDPEFLFKLAIPFAYVLPSGTTVRVGGLRPLPATGPYRIASASRDGSLRLVRNSRFREWSGVVQPAGFADEIVFRVRTSAPERVRLVAAGEADFTTTSGTRPFAVAPVQRPQFHVQPLPATSYLALDTTRPPFDDRRARRALNFAVDRSRVIRLGRGPGAAKPTCQVLPPNFPGYKPYCPYTPDLQRSRRLVTASGTGGAEVVIWSHRIFGEREGRYLEQLLDSLGYRARLRVFSGDIGTYFSAVETKRTWHVAASAWFADYPAASNFLNLLSCSSSSNFGRFCDRAVDARIRRALRLQQTDPPAANGLWAELDRELTDRAAWVSLYTVHSGDFVSKRVGNYQHHPLWGALLAQLWVR